ncbi:hypothetical protein DL96DRAFT_602908 [Flagelloscypha sp. PMI_526]|nr:hypothetical protein DL96DRAFT_602908 [Flagelloscypha sp. PMI_526]
MSRSPHPSNPPTAAFADLKSNPKQEFEKDTPSPRKKFKSESSNRDRLPRLRPRKELALKSSGHQSRPKTTRGARSAGLLKQLAHEAPLDILLDIFSYVSFEDLYSLSCSFKSVRSLLMNKSQAGTERLWARALEVFLEAPSKPEELSEPKFSRILFDTSCMVCASESAQYFSAYRRLCESCLHAHASFNPEDADQPPLAATCDDLGVTWNQFAAALVKYHPPAITPSTNGGDNGSHRGLFQNMWSPRHSQAEIESLIVALRSLPRETRSNWLEERVAAKEVKDKFIIQCQQWDRNEDPRKRTLRLNHILDRIRILGWGEELALLQHNYSLYNLQQIPGISSTDRLTDDQWSSLRPKVIGFMVKTKSERLAREIRETRTSRLETLKASRMSYRTQVPPTTIVPPVIDLALLTPFMEIIETQDVLKAGFIRELFDELFLKLFPATANEWLDSIHRTLLLKEVRGTEEVLHPISILYQARTTVSCQTCGMKNMRYPQALYHPCGHDQFAVMGKKKKKGEDIPPIEKAFTECLIHVRPSHRQTLSLNLGTTGSDTSTLFDLCGLDPEAASYADIMQANPLFECTACTTRNGRFVMNYPSALIHRSTIHPTPGRVGPPEYRLMTDSDCTDLGITKNVYDRSPAFLTSFHYMSNDSDGRNWLCRHCGTEPTSTDMAMRHLSEDHDILTPQEGKDYMVNHENTLHVWQEWGYRHSVRKRNAGQ